MAQHRMRSEGEGGRHPSSLDGEAAVADRVHASMDDMKRAVPDPTFDHLRGHPKLLQLPPGDDPVLAPGQVRHRQVKIL